MKSIIIFFVSFLVSLQLFAQKQISPDRQRCIYVEALGPGVLSFNYDMRFSQKEKGLGFRAGVGGFTTNSVIVPLDINYLLGNRQNLLELGIGASFQNKDLLNTRGMSSSLTGYATIGYRFQPIKNGLTFRIVANPLLDTYDLLPFYGGVSLGYKF